MVASPSKARNNLVSDGFVKIGACFMVKIYGLKACDSCKKAQKAFKAAGISAELIDIRENPLSEEQLALFLSELGEKLLNTRSTTWRNLPEEDRSNPVLSLLASHPPLMKRPIVQSEDRLTLGWTSDVQEQWL